MKTIKLIAIGFAALITLQIFFGLYSGHGFENGVGATLFLAFLAGLIGLLAVNIHAIVETSGENLSASTERMQNAFFYSAMTIGTLLSLQAIISLLGSPVVFIPFWLRYVIYVGVGIGILGWITCAAVFSIAKGIDMFREWVSTGYRWLIMAAILVIVALLVIAFNDANFSLTQKDNLFQFGAGNNTEISNGGGVTVEKDEIAKLQEKYKLDEEITREQLNDIKEMLRLLEKYDDGRNAQKIADLKRLVSLLEKYVDDKPAKGKSEAEQHKEKVEQTISTGGGVKVGQEVDPNTGSVNQYIVDEREPDGH